jgi:hypothetical protein
MTLPAFPAKQTPPGIGKTVRTGLQSRVFRLTDPKRGPIKDQCVGSILECRALPLSLQADGSDAFDLKAKEHRDLPNDRFSRQARARHQRNEPALPARFPWRSAHLATR